MELFEAEFAKLLSSNTFPMDDVLRYVAGAKGKRLRPMLVFLTAKLFGEINDTSRHTALFVELLHTATLIHDDVVDDSDKRRGQASVNAHWNNATAVLTGDYLLSKAMLQLIDPTSSPILKEMLSTTMAMSEGELMQNAEFGIRNSELYLNIIERKTARLMKACCVGGALSVGATDEQVTKVGEFGLNYGMVFQMRDDILDADNSETTALAKQLLPAYLDRTSKALDALKPMSKNASAWETLRALTLF